MIPPTHFLPLLSSLQSYISILSLQNTHNQINRDRDAPLEQKRTRHFSDSEFCKYYLCGLCPYQLFKNTKSDLGVYDKILDDKMRDEWNKLPQSEKDKYGYEYDLMSFLGRLVSDVDRKVRRGIARIESERRQARDTQKRLLQQLSPEDRLKLRQNLSKYEDLDEKSVRFFLSPHTFFSSTKQLIFFKRHDLKHK